VEHYDFHGGVHRVLSVIMSAVTGVDIPGGQRDTSKRVRARLRSKAAAQGTNL
jgi:hypothetical protein